MSIQSTGSFLVSISVLVLFSGYNLFAGEFWFAAGCLLLAIASGLYCWEQQPASRPAPLVQRFTGILALLGLGLVVLDALGALP